MRNHMVTQSSIQDSDVFHAVADPTRRAILDRLSRKEAAAGEIASAFPVSRPAISKHLRVLRHAGLIYEAKVGRNRIYRLQPERLREIDRWLAEYRRFWQISLQNLKAYVEAEEQKEG